MPYCRREDEALGALGHEIEIFELGARKNMLGLLRCAVAYQSVRWRFQPDVIHAHYGAMTACFSTILASGTPVVITFRGSDLNPVPSGGRLGVVIRHLFSQLGARFADGIVCVSAELRDRLWWRRNIASVVPTGVAQSEFQPLARDVARRRLGWDSAAPVVVFNAGREPDVKRLDVAVAVIERVRDRWPDVRFEVLDGRRDSALVPTILNASDCLLLTSDFEGSPTIVQEAIACNLPVVSVPVGDVPERLRTLRHCHVVPSNVEALAAALAGVLAVRARSNGAETPGMEAIALESTAKRLEQAFLLACLRGGPPLRAAPAAT